MHEGPSYFVMPSLGADMTEGAVIEWLVAPGDRVKPGDIVATIDTEKAEIDAEIFQAGTIGELLVLPGEKVAVGTPLAIVVPDDVSIAAAAGARLVLSTQAPTAPLPLAAVVPATPEVDQVAGRPATGTHSPLVRHLAEQHGIDIATIPGSGLGGAVTREDVQGAIDRSNQPPARRGVRASPKARRVAAAAGIRLDTVVGTGPGGAVLSYDVAVATPDTLPPPTGSAVRLDSPPARAGRAKNEATRQLGRRAIAELMSRSKREIPHYYLAHDISFAAAATWLTATNAERPARQRLLPVAIVLRAIARSAQEVPGFNGHWVDGVFQPSETIHLGVAIAQRGGGLLAPCIHDAAALSLDELMGRLRDLVQRARSGRIRSSEMSEPTITVTALGDLGVQQVFGVIYPPQVAMIGVGAITERPWAEHGMIGARPVVTVTLAGDHRVSDGLDGARLLAHVDRVLQAPPDVQENTL